MTRSSPPRVTFAVPASMMKKPIPRCPSAAITSPAANVRSLNVRASCSASFRSRSEKSGTPVTRGSGALTRRILLTGRAARSAVRPSGELVDPTLRGVELGDAGSVQLLAALPERDRLVEPGPAALQSLDDLLELA